MGNERQARPEAGGAGVNAAYGRTVIELIEEAKARPEIWGALTHETRARLEGYLAARAKAAACMRKAGEAA